MTVATDNAAGISSSWLSSLGLCCWPLHTPADERPYRIAEKEGFTLVREQPNGRSQPLVLPVTESPTKTMAQDKPSRKSFGSSRTSFSTRSRFWSDASSRRPQISAPTDFRHVSTSSLHFSVVAGRQTPTPPRPVRPVRSSSFRPLELSLSNDEISPILPHVGIRDHVPSPPPAYVRDSREDHHYLNRQRSYTSLSFHIPRKYAAEDTPERAAEDLPPIIPPKSQNRARAYTAPEVETIKERVASAMIEMERLQQQIDNVIERQSLYSASRPSSSHSMARTMPEMEPMPSIPALPPSAPSFAQRLNCEMERPRTAPINFSLLGMSQPKKPAVTSSSATNIHEGTKQVEKQLPPPPPPPLPLVLRPPLRKKKSFSRVSTWLFPNPEHSRDLSFDSVTNLPKAINAREGFYQCVTSEDEKKRQSLDSIDSASLSWETDDDDAPTGPTTWSPASTPAVKQEDSPLVVRRYTFGENDKTRPGIVSVGTAV